MTYRDLSGLVDSRELISFAKDYQMQIIVDQPYLWLYNKIIAFRVYGVVIENHVNIELFNIAENTFCPASHILEGLPSEVMKQVYQRHCADRLSVHTQLVSPNNYTIAQEAEAYLFSYLELLSTYFKEEIESGFIKNSLFKKQSNLDIQTKHFLTGRSQ